MAPEWPIAAPPAEQGADPARVAGRRRLSTVREDFLLPPEERLSEQERALMTGMLADLLASIAVEISVSLPSGMGFANDVDGQQLVLQLGSTGLLDSAELIDLLLRRADEERVGSAIRFRSGATPAYLQALIAEEDSEVSAKAMALILARGRRRDRLGQLRVELDDLPRQVAQQLVHAVAAAVRTTLPPSERDTEADRHLAVAADDLLARHDPGRCIEAAIAHLVRSLADSGKLDDAVLAAACAEGDVAFIAEALAQRAGIDRSSSWDHLLDGGQGRFVLLLRMARIPRDLAARLLAALGELIGISDLARDIARFEQMDEGRAAAAQDWLRLDPRYRAALQAMEKSRG